MSTQGAASGGRVRRALGWVREAPAKRVGGPLGALALAISGAFGGLNAVDNSSSYTRLAADQVVETGPAEISVLRVRATDDLKPFLRPMEETNRLLVIVMKLRNTTKQPVASTLITGELGIKVDGAKLADVGSSLLRMNDGSRAGNLQPDVTYEVALVLETVGQDVPTKVDVSVPQFTWREDSFTPGFFDWRDPMVVAEGSFPVKEAPDSPADPS